MATIVAVARAAKVSTATVSAVLNGTKFVSEPLRVRVLEAVRATGYRPHGVARSLKNGRTRTVGLVITDVTNPYATAIARSIEDAAHAAGYALILCNSDEDFAKEAAYLELMRTQRVDGLILAPCGRPEDYRGALAALPMPLVLVDRLVAGLAVDAIVVNNRAASRQAVDHLIALGHQRIAVIAGPSHLSTSEERLAGYREALEGRVPFDENLVCQGNFRIAEAYRAASALLARKPRPTAVFAANNLMALGVLQAVQEAGLRCPEDISLIAFDDFDGAALFRPALSTIAQPTAAIGQAAFARLLARMEGGEAGPAQPEAMKVTFHLRGSCGPPPHLHAAGDTSPVAG